MSQTIASTIAGDRFLTVGEVCAITGRSRASIYRDEKKGTFPEKLKFGGKTRFSLIAVNAYMAELRAA